MNKNPSKGTKNSSTSDHQRTLTVSLNNQSSQAQYLTKAHESPIFMCMCYFRAIKDIVCVHYDKPKFGSDGQQTGHYDGSSSWTRGQRGVNTCSTGVRERNNSQRMEGHIRSQVQVETCHANFLLCSKLPKEYSFQILERIMPCQKYNFYQLAQKDMVMFQECFTLVETNFPL